jgi:hypothetical protein
MFNDLHPVMLTSSLVTLKWNEDRVQLKRFYRQKNDRLITFYFTAI